MSAKKDLIYMKLYISENPAAKSADVSRRIAADDMILTSSLPTTAGSRMLKGYMSLFGAEVLTRLHNAGFTLAGKANVGEFAVDLLGETSYFGAVEADGKLSNAAAELLKAGEVSAVITLDVNGYPSRAAAQNGLISLKPTYGTVSRFGVIPAACSGDTVSIMANDIAAVSEIFAVIAGHDDKDGTSHPEAVCETAKTAAVPVKRIALPVNLTEGINEDVKGKLAAFTASAEAAGIEVVKVESDIIAVSNIAWNILMSAEVCNNVSRYDSVKYGYRAENFSGIDELYTNSRTEAFGELIKSVILFGSETLSADKYNKQYDKALRIRRLIVEAFAELFSEYDAVLLPACSALSYDKVIRADKYAVYTENRFTAPASITGLPAVVCGSVQLIGRAFSDGSLLAAAAKITESEGK